MRLALIDADIVAYAVAFKSEEEFDFAASGTKAKHVDKATCWRLCDMILAKHCEAVKAGSLVVCLTDPDVNFRKQFDPTYKSNRKAAVKPELLTLAKEYMHENYRSYIKPRLEADDVMGILATRPRLLGKSVTDVVIVSEDKDMRTIPAKVYNPNYPDLGILEITKTEAMQFHLWQTITGDVTDGYPGCKGLGAGGEFDPEQGAFVLGARSMPYAHDALTLTNPLEMWDNVIEAFASKGFTEDDAIHQARLARILWADDYNFKSNKIRLWNPTRLFW